MARICVPRRRIRLQGMLKGYSPSLRRKLIIPFCAGRENVPLTFGHEFAGRIEELGEGVSESWKVGDRVVVQPIIYDGDCGACQDGLINCCTNNGFIGLSGWGGGLAEHIVVPEYAVYPLPNNVPLDVAGKRRLKCASGTC